MNLSTRPTQSPLVAITLGDVAGIGPEVVVRAIEHLRGMNVCGPLLIGHPGIIQDAADLVGASLPLSVIGTESLPDVRSRSTASDTIMCWNPSTDDILSAPRRVISAAAGNAAFQYLNAAIELAQQGTVDAIVTAPLNKESLHLAGHHYPGHTEILAARCGVSEFAMMLHLPEPAIAKWRPLVGGAQCHEPGRHGLSIAHVTLHTSVASVPELLTVDAIADTIRLMNGFLLRIGCDRAKIAVAALNPHGGEHGLFGNEEQTVIQPAVERCSKDLPNVHGPLPIDTLMRRAVAGEFDGIVAMYHDQGHIPIKLIGFDRAVNITLGLPIVRTSPTHGTAFDRAWNSETPADAMGMVEAIRTAVLLATLHT